jgi:hypothetical protein
LDGSQHLEQAAADAVRTEWLQRQGFTLLRFRRRVRAMQAAYAAGRLDWPTIVQRLMSWVGHAKQANSYRLLEGLFGNMSFQRAANQ